jgi:NAD(P)-dependent dehydrogenase (short-subunit alcohol dehydrogenase family)
MTSPLTGRIALVAGATRGAGRGIAVELGGAGATVYVSGTVLTSWDLADEYNINDIDGTHPHWGRHFNTNILNTSTNPTDTPPHPTNHTDQPKHQTRHDHQ